MKKESFVRRIISIALPLMIQQLCLQFQVWIDRAMLGHANTEFFSAVGNALVPYNAAVAIINAICGGTAILAAHRIGAGNTRALKALSRSSYLGNTLISAGAFLLFLFFTDPLFSLMGVKEPILGYSAAYIRIVSISLLALGPMATSSALLQGMGSTRMIMLSSITGNVINILLDWLLINGRFGLPAMGIAGAAWATTIANFIAAPMLIIHVLRCREISPAGESGMGLTSSLHAYGAVLKMGLPSGLEYALWHVGNMFVVSYLNRLDIMAAGIYTLIFSIESLPLLIYMGFANAGLTLVGQKTGERDPRQARRAGFACLGFSLAVCAAVAMLFLALPRGILALFTNDAGLVDYAAPYLMFTASIMFPKAINAVIGLCIRGTGDTRWMLFTQVFGTVFVIICSRCLIFTAGLGLMGIFVTLLADEGLRGLMNLIHFIRRTRT